MTSLAAALRWVPAVLIFAALGAVFVWIAMQPIEDTRASLAALVAVSLLCLAAIPALHFGMDS